jgi:hypothetical protein
MDIENGVVIFDDYLKRIVTAARPRNREPIRRLRNEWEDGSGVRAWLAPLRGRHDIASTIPTLRNRFAIPVKLMS